MTSNAASDRQTTRHSTPVGPGRKTRLLIVCQGDIHKASSRVRGYQLVEPLREQGLQVRVRSVAKSRGESGGSLKRKFLRRRFLKGLHRDLKWTDVVLAQRLVKGSSALNLVHQCPKPMIYDFDDALYERPRDVSGHIIGHKGKIETGQGDPSEQQAWVDQIDWFHKFLGQADLCTVTNPMLGKWFRDHYHDKNVVEITGPIDTDRFTPGPPQVQKKVIGWIGSASTTPYLEIVAGGLGKVLESHQDWAVWLVGAKSSTVKSLGLDARVIPWTLESEVELLQRFSVGIQPLPDDPWSRGKGGYKALQYMAVGIPAVSSPVSFNCSLVKDGITGFLAVDEHQWIECLEKLIRNSELRRTLGKAARVDAVACHSVHCAATRLAPLVQDLAARKGVLS